MSGVCVCFVLGLITTDDNSRLSCWSFDRLPRLEEDLLQEERSGQMLGKAAWGSQSQWAGVSSFMAGLQVFEATDWS